MSRGGFPPVAVAFAVVGGLLLVGATSGSWVVAEELREVGGVPLAEPQATPGIELTPQLVAPGVLSALAGLALIVARGRGRRVLGLLLVVTGAVAGVLVGVGVVRATGEPGQLTPAPWVATAGAAATIAAGVVAWRRPAPPPALGDRYSIDAADAGDDGEWDAASDEP